MNPSSETVIRFVASYGHGFSFPFRRLILGHGYQESGHSHNQILEIYLGKKILENAKEKVYAGYLYLQEDQVKVFALGGSQTLGIEGSEEKKKNLLEEINVLSGIKVALIHNFPLLISGKIPHMMLAH